MRFTTITIIFLLLLYSKNLFAQETYDYKQISTESGLASSEAHFITSDNRGYLWIATDRGLSRFDGKKFTNYDTKHGLSSMYVNRVFIDPFTNTVWVRCMDGLLYYKNKDFFYPAPFNKSLAEALKDNFQIQNEIYNVQFTPTGISRLYTSAHGMYEVKNNEVKKQATTAIASFSFDGFAMAYYQSMEKIRKLKSIGSLDFFDKKIAINSSQFNSPLGIINLYPDKKIIYFRNMLFLLEGDHITKQFNFDYVILKAYLDNSGSLWIIPYSGDGAYKFKKGEFPNGNNGINLYKGFSFTGMTQDIEGGYWFTSSIKGLIYQPNSIATVVKTPISKNPNQYIKGVVAIDDELLVASSYPSQIFRLKNKAWDQLAYYTEANPKIKKMRMRIINFSDFKLTEKPHEVHIGYPFSSLYNTTNSTLSKKIDGSKFLLRSGLETYCVGSTNIVFRYIDDQLIDSVILAEKILDLIITSDNKILLGTNTGIYELKQMKIAKLQIFPDSLRVNSIARSPNHTIAATFGKGLFIFNQHGGRFVRMGESTQLNTVNTVLCIGDTIIAGTQDGIVWTYASNPEKKYFLNNRTGLNINDVRSLSYAKGFVYAIGNNKLFKFTLNNRESNFQVPVFIEKFTVNDTQQINFNQPISLKSNQNRINISFSALSYQMGTHGGYYYRLKNDDSKPSYWTYTDNSYLELLSMKPGNYTAEIKSVNPDYSLSDKTAVINFTIERPFYNSPPFILLLILLIIAAAAMALLYINRRMRKSNQIAEKLLEYEQQALSAQINPHFIFNSLSSIQSFIINKDERQSLKYISKFSRLMRASLENSRQKWVPLQQEVDLLQVYIELEKMRFGNSFDFSISIAENLDAYRIQIPSMLLQPFIENAILHGINNLSDRTGKLFLQFDLINNEKELRVTIDDNGIGREKANLLNTVKANKRSSAGLSITENRLKLLSKELNQHYLIQFTDKPNHQGTTVILNMPFKKN